MGPICRAALRALLVALVFAAVGPLVGYAVFMVGAGLAAGFESGEMGKFAFAFFIGPTLLLLPFTWAFIYYFGALPAALTGVVVSVITPLRSRLVKLVSATLCGFITTVGHLALVFGMKDADELASLGSRRRHLCACRRLRRHRMAPARATPEGLIRQH